MEACKKLRRITRGQIRSVAMKLAKDQGGVCLLCGKPLDFTLRGVTGDSVVVDHDHITGRIRGALHRSCNGGEGKVASAAGRWIVGSMQSNADIAAALRRVADYLDLEPTDLLGVKGAQVGCQVCLKSAGLNPVMG